MGGKRNITFTNIFECFMQKRCISFDKNYGFHNIYKLHPPYSASFRELVITFQLSYNILVTIRMKASFTYLQSLIFCSINLENCFKCGDGKSVSIKSSTSAPFVMNFLIDHYIIFDQLLNFMNQ